MRYENPADPVYAPNSYGGPQANPALAGEVASSYGVNDEVVRAAYRLHPEDDDYGSAGHPGPRGVRRRRPRPAGRQRGRAPAERVSEPVLLRASEYWRSVDKQIGDRIADAVRNGG